MSRMVECNVNEGKERDSNPVCIPPIPDTCLSRLGEEQRGTLDSLSVDTYSLIHSGFCPPLLPLPSFPLELQIPAGLGILLECNIDSLNIPYRHSGLCLVRWVNSRTCTPLFTVHCSAHGTAM